MAQQQRPPPRTRSSTALSNSSMSSSMPSSPGPSVSVRAIATPALSAKSSPGPSGYLAARSTSSNSFASGSNAVASSSKAGVPSRGHARDRSTSGFSVSTTSTSTRTAAHHSRRRPTLMGGNSSSRLSKTQLASYNSSNQANRMPPGMISPPVPDILINGAERPEDVDVAAIGRLPSLSAANPMRSSPEATSVGVDSLFARFGVKEVRTIAQRGKLKAESKREELRTMVGERYRDLLGAADSIVRMRKSSSVLLERLSGARQECDRENMLSRAAEEDITRSRLLSHQSTPLASGHTPYSVATLVKLLLDCPEHIWRCLEKEDYLSAARLDSVGRAVYRELVSTSKKRAGRNNMHGSSADSDNDETGYDSDQEDEGDESGLLSAFPLVEQQFDSLDQLAPQISSRATLHLRSWDVPALDVTKSLATLVMLDKLSIEEALRLLLDQRSKSLASLFQNTSSHGGPTIRRPSARPVLGTSNDLDGRTVTDVVNRISNALELALYTHEHVFLSFTSPSGDRNSLLHILRLLQQSSSDMVESPNTTLSIVHAQAQPSNPASFTALPPILATLPNAHILLRYLPEQILTFTPFIDIDSNENMVTETITTATLKSWFTEAVQTFQVGLDQLFSELHAAAQLAIARDALKSLLSEKTQIFSSDLTKQAAVLAEAVDQSCARRFVQIYSAKLEGLTRAVPQALDGALRALPGSPEDLDPVTFLYSASIPFPASSVFRMPAGALSTLSTMGKTVTVDPFALFKQALSNRVEGRSPVLAECLRELESAAQDVRKDVLTWLNSSDDQRSRAGYLASTRDTLSVIEQSIRTTLESAEDSPSQIFVGTLAAHLALNSSFVQSLLLEEPAYALPDEDKAALLSLEEASSMQWRKHAVQEASDSLAMKVQAQLQLPCSADCTQPSGHIVETLHILSNCVNRLGLHRSQAIPATVSTLLSEFEEAVSAKVYNESLLEEVNRLGKTERRQQSQQLLYDMRFLQQTLNAGLGRRTDFTLPHWESTESALSRLAANQMKTDGPSDQMLRMQNLLAPILSSSRWKDSLLREDTEAINMLLPFGVPTTASALDAKLDLAKPGPRFALLPVNTIAA